MGFGPGARIRRALARILAFLVWPFAWLLAKLRSARSALGAGGLRDDDAAAVRASLSARHAPKSSPLLDLEGDEDEGAGTGDDDSAYGRDDAGARRFEWIGQVRQPLLRLRAPLRSSAARAFRGSLCPGSVPAPRLAQPTRARPCTGPSGGPSAITHAPPKPHAPPLATPIPPTSQDDLEWFKARIAPVEGRLMDGGAIGDGWSLMMDKHVPGEVRPGARMGAAWRVPHGSVLTRADEAPGAAQRGPPPPASRGRGSLRASAPLTRPAAGRGAARESGRAPRRD